MTFNLGEKSLKELNGDHKELVAVVNRLDNKCHHG